MEDIKFVVLDNGRIMVEFEDGSMSPVYADKNGVWVDVTPNSKTY